ncbi:MAG: outer membrane protein assembly factor BamD [Burkholderiaceae bacterium]|nr:outer membrane protein assembly factor BamD [Burkholderiaceae bacterium]
MNLTQLPRCTLLSSLALLVLAALVAGCGSTANDDAAAMSTEKLYAEAKEEAASGNYEKAAQLYERLEGRAAGTLIAQQAQLERAWVLYKSGDRVGAQVVVERFIKLNPSSTGLDYALYLQGLLNFNDNLGFLGNLARQELSERDQQASRDSYQSFRQLIERFPRSKYAADAKQRMNFIFNSLAAYELHVARYYLRRGAYVAAAARAQQAVQEFQGSPSAEEALYIMVQSYDKLGLDELRDDARRVLNKNFPDSEYLAGGGWAPKGRAWWQFW